MNKHQFFTLLAVIETADAADLESIRLFKFDRNKAVEEFLKTDPEFQPEIF